TCAYLFHRLMERPVPFSIWLHAGTDLYRSPVYLREKLGYADGIITCCEFNRRFLEERYADAAGGVAAKVYVSYHGLDLAAFPYRPEGRPARTVLAVGRFARAKGFDHLLRAAGALSARGTPIDVELVGDGPERAALAALARDLGLGERVRFRGWLPFAEVLEAMRRATILVHPSPGLGDGLPNVLREAMAVGTPVVASRVAGIPEALDDGRCGVLVPPADVAALTDAIAGMLADESRRREFAADGPPRSFEPAPCRLPAGPQCGPVEQATPPAHLPGGSPRLSRLPRLRRKAAQAGARHGPVFLRHARRCGLRPGLGLAAAAA